MCICVCVYGSLARLGTLLRVSALLVLYLVDFNLQTAIGLPPHWCGGVGGQHHRVENWSNSFHFALITTKGVNPCSNMGGMILGEIYIPLAGCIARRKGGSGACSPEKNFFKGCNLVRFGVYLDQILC